MQPKMMRWGKYTDESVPFPGYRETLSHVSEQAEIGYIAVDNPVDLVPAMTYWMAAQGFDFEREIYADPTNPHNAQWRLRAVPAVKSAV